MVAAPPLPAVTLQPESGVYGPHLWQGEFDILSGYSPMDSEKGEVTVLLARLATGDRAAEEALLPRVYGELRRLAQIHLRSERAGHTLQPTALVHEVYLRLCRQERVDWADRCHFFRLSARLMRRILIDYGRNRNALKRGDGRVRVELNDCHVPQDQLALALELDDALTRLAKKRPRQAEVVEMRFFAGLTEEEIATVLGVNVRTVKRDWLMARAWLHEQLSGSRL